MTSQASETKIEIVTECIEALVLATVVATTSSDTNRAANHQNVLDARGTLRHALREMLKPSLRVLETIPAPDARPAYPVA